MGIASLEIEAELRRLHDAVLVAIEIVWASGTATLSLRTAEGPLRIVMEGVTRVECPRELPWGRSECIGEVRPSAGGMTIAMQSGDVIAVRCSRVTTAR